MGIMTRSAALMKLAAAHNAIVLLVFVNCDAMLYSLIISRPNPDFQSTVFLVPAGQGKIPGSTEIRS